jgi:hypothetical protein
MGKTKQTKGHANINFYPQLTPSPTDQTKNKDDNTQNQIHKGHGIPSQLHRPPLDKYGDNLNHFRQKITIFIGFLPSLRFRIVAFNNASGTTNSYRVLLKQEGRAQPAETIKLQE